MTSSASIIPSAKTRDLSAVCVAYDTPREDDSSIVSGSMNEMLTCGRLTAMEQLSSSTSVIRQCNSQYFEVSGQINSRIQTARQSSRPTPNPGGVGPGDLANAPSAST